MKTIQSVGVWVKASEMPNDNESKCVILNDGRYSTGTYLNERWLLSIHSKTLFVTHWLKPTSAILYSKEEHDAVVEAVGVLISVLQYFNESGNLSGATNLRFLLQKLNTIV